MVSPGLVATASQAQKICELLDRLTWKENLAASSVACNDICTAVVERNLGAFKIGKVVVSYFCTCLVRDLQQVRCTSQTTIEGP